MQTVNPSLCVFPTTTFEQRVFSSKDNRVFQPGERVCYRSALDEILAADYIDSTPSDIERHRLRLYFPNGGSPTYPVLWFTVGKLSHSRQVAELGKEFNLPPEIDDYIHSQITGKTRKQGTPEQKRENLSKLSKKIDKELERQKMIKEDKPAANKSNTGGRKSRRQKSSKRRKTLRRI
jgi:hypothetical protein